MDSMDLDVKELTETYKSWTDTFAMHSNELIAKQFAKMGPIKIQSLHEMNNVLASFFKGKPQTTVCEFVLIPQDGYYEMELTEEQYLDYVDASVNSIPCLVLTKAIEKMDLNEPLVLTAQCLGFAWRTDGKPIMEIFDILQEMESAR